MNEVVIAALIGAVASIIVNLISVAGQRKKAEVEEARKQQELKDKLTRIETQLEIHNGYAEKIGSIQKDIAVIKTKLEFLSEK